MELIRQNNIRWIPWSYHAKYLTDDLIRSLQNGLSLTGKEVLFACMAIGRGKEAHAIREGIVDYWSFSGNTLCVTVFLGDLIDKRFRPPSNEHLCFYLPRS